MSALKTTLTSIPGLFDLHKTFDPFTVGYDKIFQQLEEMSNTMVKNVPTYPPYNIRKVSDDKYVIEMAVAGFAKTDIEVTLEGNTLVVKGNTSEAENEYDYIFKGIANRNFMRSFTIADKIEIKDAQLVNGMLSVFLENMVKAQDTIKKISVKG